MISDWWNDPGSVEMQSYAVADRARRQFGLRLELTTRGWTARLSVGTLDLGPSVDDAREYLDQLQSYDELGRSQAWQHEGYRIDWETGVPMSVYDRDERDAGS